MNGLEEIGEKAKYQKEEKGKGDMERDERGNERGQRDKLYFFYICQIIVYM